MLRMEEEPEEAMMLDLSTSIGIVNDEATNAAATCGPHVSGCSCICSHGTPEGIAVSKRGGTPATILSRKLASPVGCLAASTSLTDSKSTNLRPTRQPHFQVYHRARRHEAMRIARRCWRGAWAEIDVIAVYGTSRRHVTLRPRNNVPGPVNATICACGACTYESDSSFREDTAAVTKRVKGWRIAGRKGRNLAGCVGKSTVGAGITHHARANLGS
jgi:hypothetical protein